MSRDCKGNDHPPLAGDPAQGLCLMPALTSLGTLACGAWKIIPQRVTSLACLEALETRWLWPSLLSPIFQLGSDFQQISLIYLTTKRSTQLLHLLTKTALAKRKRVSPWCRRNSEVYQQTSVNYHCPLVPSYRKSLWPIVYLQPNKLCWRHCALWTYWASFTALTILLTGPILLFPCRKRNVDFDKLCQENRSTLLCIPPCCNFPFLY